MNNLREELDKEKYDLTSYQVELLQQLFYEMAKEVIGEDVPLQVKDLEQAKIAQIDDWYQNELKAKQRANLQRMMEEKA